MRASRGLRADFWSPAKKEPHFARSRATASSSGTAVNSPWSENQGKNDSFRDPSRRLIVRAEGSPLCLQVQARDGLLQQHAVNSPWSGNHQHRMS